MHVAAIPMPEHCLMLACGLPEIVWNYYGATMQSLVWPTLIWGVVGAIAAAGQLHFYITTSSAGHHMGRRCWAAPSSEDLLGAMALVGFACCQARFCVWALDALDAEVAQRRGLLDCSGLPPYETMDGRLGRSPQKFKHGHIILTGFFGTKNHAIELVLP